MKQIGRKDEIVISFPVTFKGSDVLLWPGERIRNIFSPYFMTANFQHFCSLSMVVFPKIYYMPW